MKSTLQKLHICLLMAEYKCLGMSGHPAAQQNALERIVRLHTRMRVEKEQLANKLLFEHLQTI
jgi:hypothetical protein